MADSLENISVNSRPEQATLDTHLPAAENRLYYPALDGLRTLAAFLVFTAHYFLFLPPTLYWGRIGVDIFFVLSGFLITGILFDSAGRPDRYAVFYKRRILRIFPLYYLALFLPVLMEPYFHWKLHPGLWLWPIYLGNYARFIWPHDFHGAGTIFEVLRSTRNAGHLFTWNFDHFWSLCVEEQFYLLWPLLVFSIKDRRRLRNLCLVIVAIAPLLRWLCLITLPPQLVNIGFLYLATPLRADSLLLGGAIALTLRGPEGARLRSVVIPAAWGLGFIFASWQLVSRLHFGHFIDPVWSSMHNPLFSTFNAFLAAVLILASIEPGRHLYRLLSKKLMRAVGQRSYGFYVYHLMRYSVFRLTAIKLTFGHKGIANATLPLVALVGTLVVSWISFHYFEAPMLRLKKKWAP